LERPNSDYLFKIIYLFIGHYLETIPYADSVDNTAEQNSSIFSLIWMH